MSYDSKIVEKVIKAAHKKQKMSFRDTLETFEVSKNTYNSYNL